MIFASKSLGGERMKIKSFGGDTTGVFQGILLGILTYYLPLPWWKWIIYAGCVIGIKIEWNRG